MKSLLKLYFVFGVIFSSSSFSYAYIENVTKGYPTCLSCHYSPSGGDLLTEYGRSLSNEMMSTFSNENFAKPLFDVVKESKWAKYGGDLRTVQTYVDTPGSTNGRLFLMQANAEIGLEFHEKAMFVGTVGVQGGPNESDARGDFISERHYVLVTPNQTSRIRVGKFRTNFGINDPNHTRAIKSRIHFGFLSETYNLEYTKFSENWELSINLGTGRLDKERTNSNDEDALSAKFTHFINGKSRIGGSLLYGTKDTEDRFVLAAHGIFPVAKKFYGIFEIDYENSDVKSAPSTNELVTMHTRFGYKPLKGLLAYALYDYTKANLESSLSEAFGPGFGVQWFPYPHFELSLELQRQRIRALNDNVDAGFLVAHIYF